MNLGRTRQETATVALRKWRGKVTEYPSGYTRGESKGTKGKGRKGLLTECFRVVASGFMAL